VLEEFTPIFLQLATSAVAFPLSSLIAALHASIPCFTATPRTARGHQHNCVLREGPVAEVLEWHFLSALRWQWLGST